jgi:TetR/AcrR family transcriptional repressor of nem operon
MGRIREFDTTEVLLKSMNVFWTNGYQATSLENLMEATGLNKQSLYTAYGDKRSLFLKALDLYINISLEELTNKITNKKSPLKAISNTLMAIANSDLNVHPKGCLVSRSATEFGDRDPEISKMFDNFNSKTEKIIEKAITEAQTCGEVTKTLTAHHISKLMMTLVIGARVLQQSSAPDKDIQMTFKAIIKLIKKELP